MSVTDASFPIINWSKAMPSLRQLMYFACVAEYGSIGQAAEVLHVSQPSLSRRPRVVPGRGDHRRAAEGGA